MKRLVIIALLFILPSTAFSEDVKISVKGMVCSFCAQGIRKTLGNEQAVEDVKVDLDKKLVTITVKDGKTLTDEEIQRLIQEAGYDVLSIERGKDA